MGTGRALTRLPASVTLGRQPPGARDAVDSGSFRSGLQNDALRERDRREGGRGESSGLSAGPDGATRDRARCSVRGRARRPKWLARPPGPTYARRPGGGGTALILRTPPSSKHKEHPIPPHAAVSEIRENLRRVRARIAHACANAGRNPDDVTLVAVTKSVGIDELLELHRLGVRDFGENRPQALIARRAEFEARTGPPTDDADRVRWHMIGHLQRNKVRALVPAADLIHSVDSLRLLASLSDEGLRRQGTRVEVLIQVNVSGETQKDGLARGELRPLLERSAELEGVRVRGLMCMAPLEASAADLRAVFRALRELRDETAHRSYLGSGELSMGMSGDFEIAVEQGATHVRVGGALFGQR